MKAYKSLVSCEFWLAESLNFSCAPLISFVKSSWSLLILSYFPPVSWSLLFSSSFYWLNLWTLCLNSSIYLTNEAVCPADSLSFSCPYLTCPASPRLSFVICWILFLKESSYLVSLSFSEDESLNFYCPSRIWLAKDSLSFLDPSYFIPKSLSLSSSKLFLWSNSDVFFLNDSI